MKILVADDYDAARRVLKESLANFGHEVVEAKDGAEAWAEFDKEPLPVIISDWMMPGLSGLELCRKVRARPLTPYTFFLLISGGRTDRNDYVEAMEAGVDDFMFKPFDEEMLWFRLHAGERLLRLYAEVRELRGILPVCGLCRSVRRDDHAFKRLEHYVVKYPDELYDGGLCPACLAKRGGR